MQTIEGDLEVFNRPTLQLTLTWACRFVSKGLLHTKKQAGIPPKMHLSKQTCPPKLF